ncbi:adenylyl-sulfate kinase [Puia dinghuensis]|uniref:Adenylyl-sulfate kinase n=1 Tax=Puia dinghuensis TaxID=1792502 RepID=A0A8J2UBE2_9BACT|nr:adenylyl-sulfate kinase [Puia dinghuensis]GGA93586.1 adenylyl-sulfate kinase [Puia dinghuensis]
MLFIQLTGLSGSGKSTIANGAKEQLQKRGYRVEVLDGDEFRKHLCRDLGFSKADRNENVRRLGIVGSLLAKNGIIAIMAAINPYEEIRQELLQLDCTVLTVWIRCDIDTLIERDPKGLYKRALYKDAHPDKVLNLTGMSDPYEEPSKPDLVVNTNEEEIFESTMKFVDFVCDKLEGNISKVYTRIAEAEGSPDCP